MSAILDKAEAFAAERKIDPAVLLGYRLAPDMFPLSRQVQIATDHAKGCCARLAGVEIPKYADDETTFADLRARIAQDPRVRAGFEPGDIDGSEERDIAITAGSRRAALQGPAVPRELRAAQLLLPRHHRLRHPPPLRPADRQARLPGATLTHLVSSRTQSRSPRNHHAISADGDQSLSRPPVTLRRAAVM